MKFTAYVLMIAGLAAYGQSPKLEFEVASIKPAQQQGFFHASDSGSGGPSTDNPGTFRCARCTLSTLILKAFALRKYQLQGAQSLPSDAYMISARIPDGATPAQFQVMLQNLLKDRFGLAYRFQTKDMQGYRLVLAKSGSKLVDAKENVAKSEPTNFHEGGHSGGSRQGVTFVYGGAQYRGDHQTTDELAEMLANQLVKPVDNQTGLTGKYDIRLNWTGENAHSDNHSETAAGAFYGGAGHDHGGGGSPGARPDNAGGPTLFDALQSQLGLKLVPGPKTTARILVVDHVNKTPTDN